MIDYTWDMTDVVRTTDEATVREYYQIGDTIEIGIPVTENGRIRTVTALIIAKCRHHALCRMPSGYMESFRWLDLATIYSVRFV